MDQRTEKGKWDARERLERAKRWRIAYVPGGIKTLVIGIAIALVAIIVLFVKPTAPPPRGPGAFAGANQGTPVGVAKAVTGDIGVTLNALGTVTPLATVTVRPQVGGQLQKINFSEGQTVSAGEVLAVIDPRPYQAAVDLTKGQLARDEAQLANARVDLTRYQKLIQENSIAQQQVDTQEALVRQLEGTIKTDNANVEQAQINLDYTSIKSPIGGRIGLRQVDTGNILTAGQATGVAVVTQLQPISVLFTVPEDSIGDIMNRVRQNATLKANAYDRAQQKLIASGALSTIDNEIDTTTGTVKLRAVFDNSKNELFPNQFVNVTLLVTTLHDQTIVPVAAVQRGAQGTFVYLVNDDHTVSLRPVTLGQTQDDKVAIAKGVMSGDTVVVDGADRLRDGAKVLLPGETPEPIATNAGRGTGAGGAGANGNGRRGGRGGRRGGGDGGNANGGNGGNANGRNGG
jgi:multidrug efflux system membrane fusion protein